MRKKKRKAGRIIALFLLLLLLSYFVGRLVYENTGFIRTVEIVGVTQSEQQEIAMICGIGKRTHMRDVDDDFVRAAMRGYGQWELLRLEKTGPASVRLYMRTRSVRALIHYMGDTLLVDEYAQLIERKSGSDQYPYVEVVGMNMLGTEPGERLHTQDTNQALSLEALLLALDETGLYSHVREIDLSDLDSISLLTVEGYIVELGDRESCTQKMQLTVPVINSLFSEGKRGGRIDVSTGRSAYYSQG